MFPAVQGNLGIIDMLDMNKLFFSKLLNCCLLPFGLGGQYSDAV